MELSKVLKSLIREKGYHGIKSPLIINVINDYHGFDEMPSSRYVLKAIIDENYIDRIKDSVQAESLVEIKNISNSLYMKYGFRNNIIAYTVNSVLESLGSTLYLVIDEEDEVVHIKKESNRHLEFQGISITGTLMDFVNKLNKKSIFQYIGIFEDNNGALFEGDYAGLENVRIEINSSPYTNEVYSVTVLSEEENEWFMLTSQYAIIKEKLDRKYGEPRFSEDLESYYQTKRILYPEMDDIEYLKYRGFALSCRYELENGTISLSIRDICRIQLNYTDKHNEKAHRELRDNSI